MSLLRTALTILMGFEEEALQAFVDAHTPEPETEPEPEPEPAADPEPEPAETDGGESSEE